MADKREITITDMKGIPATIILKSGNKFESVALSESDREHAVYQDASGGLILVRLVEIACIMYTPQSIDELRKLQSNG